MTNQRGVALIVVILIVSVIVALTIRMNRDMRSEVYEAANLSDQIRLNYVSKSGIYAAQALLLADKNDFDALSEDWANTEMLSLKSEEFFDNASFKLLIEDEGGKIPLHHLVAGNAYNVPVRDMTLRLLTGPYFRLEQETAEELVDSLKDWMDADSETTGRGSEANAKNSPFDCIDELLMIKGVSRELFYGSERFFGLANCLRVSGDVKINMNTAPKPVLRALSDKMTAEAVDGIDKYRRDEKNPVSNPGWYSNVPEAAGMNIPAGSISVKSDTFRIRADAMQGRMTRRIVAVINRNTSTKKITTLSWRVD